MRTGLPGGGPMRRTGALLLAWGAAAWGAAACSTAPATDTAVNGAASRANAPLIDLASVRIIDLSHAFDSTTLYWPNSPTAFALRSQAKGPTPGGWFYSANSYSAPEHGGTHLDAPIHFAEQGRTADQIPVSQFVAPAVVLDISAQAAANADYRLTREDRDGPLVLKPHVVPAEYEWHLANCIKVSPASRLQEFIFECSQNLGREDRMPVTGQEEPRLESHDLGNSINHALSVFPVHRVVLGLDMQFGILCQDREGIHIVEHEVTHSEWPEKHGIRINQEVVLAQAQLPECELDDFLIDVPGPIAIDIHLGQVLSEYGFIENRDRT